MGGSKGYLTGRHFGAARDRHITNSSMWWLRRQHPVPRAHVNGSNAVPLGACCRNHDEFEKAAAFFFFCAPHNALNRATRQVLQKVTGTCVLGPFPPQKVKYTRYDTCQVSGGPARTSRARTGCPLAPVFLAVLSPAKYSAHNGSRASTSNSEKGCDEN